MADPETLQLLLAAALPAPFAFRLGAIVRDGREFGIGLRFLALGSGTAVLICFLSGSLLLAVSAALAPVVLLAHARFLGAHCAPSAAEEMAAPVAAPEAGPLRESPPPDALHAGMAFLGDLLESADRVGELRHKRRLAPRMRRDGPLWDHPRLPPLPGRLICR